MKQWYNSNSEEHNIVLHQHSVGFNIGKINSTTLKSATLKNAISNSKTLSSATLNIVTLKKFNI